MIPDPDPGGHKGPTKVEIFSVLRIRDPGLGAFFTPGSGMGRKSASGSGIRDEQPGSYFLELRNHFLFFGVKFFEDPGSGMETVWIRGPGWKRVGAGIRDKHPGSATLNFFKSSYFEVLDGIF
jgi:hypothetical protein